MPKKLKNPPPAEMPEMPPQDSPRSRRPRQADLPAIEGEGVAPKRIKALEVASDAYVDVRDTRMTWTEKEVAARDKLVALMVEHGLSVYRYGDHEVKIKPGKTGVKVMNVDGTESGEEEDED